MGKRKTKTGKQKQTRAKSAKGLVKAFSKKLGISDNKMDISISSTKPVPKKASRSVEKKKLSSASKARLKRLQRKKNKLIDLIPEEREFRRQQAALEERELAVEWKRNTPTKKKHSKKKKKSASATTTATATTSPQQQKSNPFAFAPASFAVTDAEKSTQQLVQETATQVQTLQGIGTTGMAVPNHQGVSSLQAAWGAAANSSTPAWSSIISEPPPATATAPSNNNPWAVLAPVEETTTTPPPSTASFQFAPASFSLGENVDPEL